MERSGSDVISVVNQLQDEVDESKSTQYFGGDSLIVDEFTAELSDDDSTLYKLTLTADDPQLGVLPSSLDLKWDNPEQTGQSMSNYVVWQVFRDDGAFEWRIEGAHVANFTTSLSLQFIGKGTAELERIS